MGECPLFDFWADTRPAPTLGSHRQSDIGREGTSIWRDGLVDSGPLVLLIVGHEHVLSAFHFKRKRPPLPTCPLSFRLVSGLFARSPSAGLFRFGRRSRFGIGGSFFAWHTALVIPDEVFLFGE